MAQMNESNYIVTSSSDKIGLLVYGLDTFTVSWKQCCWFGVIMDMCLDSLSLLLTQINSDQGTDKQSYPYFDMGCTSSPVS